MKCRGTAGIEDRTAWAMVNENSLAMLKLEPKEYLHQKVATKIMSQL